MSSRNSNESSMNKKTGNFTNLYVKNFGADINETKLCQLFSPYGIITSCKIQTDSNGQSRGFGFVNFERPEMAQKALEKLNNYLLDNGQHLYVAPFQKKSERQNELRRIQEENLDQRSNRLSLYISNLDSTIDEKFLEGIFNQFGQVTKTHILRNGSQSKGVGFVCFNTVDETTRALNEMNGKWLLSKPVYVKLSNGMNYSHAMASTQSISSNFSPYLTQPPRSQMPYFNYSPMVFLPTMIMPVPLNNFPIPTAPPNIPVQSSMRYASQPYRSPTPTQLRVTPSSTVAKRQSYPYVPVKNDDQHNDS